MLKILTTRLKAEMLARGWSSLELARRAGIAEPRVSHLLNHGGRCRYGTIHKLAKALGVEPTALVNLKGDGE